ncbi:MAG: TnsA-like heteromeric transposase endonuclease subunit [Pseudomonadota bacterium]|nr:TnsA-like heteromeric transposase endonuclease subunit [Pseudomonadota bacterium]
MGSINDQQLISLTLSCGEVVEKREIALITKFDRNELALYREPGVRRTQKHIPGYFWVSQVNELVWYESRLEMFILKQLDFTQKIKAVLPQPFCLHFKADGKRKRHIPDFLVWLEGGQRLLINVKPRKYVDKPLNQRSFQACTELCEALGWTYATLSEPSPIFLVNLNWLGGYRRIPENFNQFAITIIEKATKRQTVKDLLADVGPEPLVRPVLFFLMWKRQLEFDTRSLLSNTSEVWLAA